MYASLRFRQPHRCWLVLPVLALLLLSACGGAASQAQQEPTPPAPDVASPTPQTSPTAATETTGDSVPTDLVAQAQSALAVELTVPTDTLMLLRAEARDWPDSALGCPQPETLYTPMIMPGYALVFGGPDDGRYTIHTAQEPAALIWCDEGVAKVLGGDSAPTPPAMPPTEPPAALVPSAPITQAHEALAAALTVPTDTLTLLRAESLDWLDGSLGCPEPDKGYTQAIVPGYLIVFANNTSDDNTSDDNTSDDNTSDEALSYPIHTTREGTPLIWCRTDAPPVVLDAP